jgi:hypothetical protein
LYIGSHNILMQWRGPRKPATTNTGPNDASHVAISMFFFVILRVF